jgi:hypothetical protein
MPALIMSSQLVGKRPVASACFCAANMIGRNSGGTRLSTLEVSSVGFAGAASAGAGTEGGGGAAGASSATETALAGAATSLGLSFLPQAARQTASVTTRRQSFRTTISYQYPVIVVKGPVAVQRTKRGFISAICRHFAEPSVDSTLPPETLIASGSGNCPSGLVTAPVGP